MKRPSDLTVKTRRLCSRLSPLLVVCQRTPVSRVIAHEAGVLGMSGFTQVAKWSVAVVSGLGAFDSVSGATVVKQIAPTPNSSTVSATNGNVLNFIVQVTGAPSTAKSWKLTGTLPTGLTHTNATNSNTDSVTGIPRQNGNFNVTLTAWEKAGYSGGSKSASFTISVTGGVTPPVISTQPASLSVSQGATAALSVAATGAASWQWYTGTSGDASHPIAGATAASYTTPALVAGDGFWVRVTNTGGFTDSSAALVTVIVPPAISAQPLSSHINPGGSVSLTVNVSGTTPTFQWYTGVSGDLTQAIPGATSSNYTTPALNITSRYWVYVSNSAGNINSDTAVVTVDIPASISAQPLSSAIPPGTSAVLSVTAAGTNPGYQWYAGLSGNQQNPVPGATGPVCTTPALSLAASYWVLVSNGAGSVNSQTAFITLLDNFSSWAATRFPSQQNDPAISGPTMDPDGDGQTNAQEFIFGTQPLTANPSRLPEINVTGDQVSVNFTANAATGLGYAGLIRHFALESSPALGTTSGPWIPVPGLSDITAQGQAIQFSTTRSGAAAKFYHVKAWLLPQ